MFKSNKATSKRRIIRSGTTLALLLILTLSLVSLVSAHQTVTIGAYDVEYGWFSEPAVTGQPNAVVINISQTGVAQPADVDVSGLKVEAQFGGESKVLTLQPLSENTPGQFVAPITPMRPGTYTIHLSGSMGSTAFNNDVVPEEVKTADLVEFPLTVATPAPAKNTLGMSGGLAIAGIVLAIVALVVGVLALVRRPKS